MADSPNDIDVISLAIYDELGDKLIDFAEQNTNGRISLGVMEFVESLGETSLRGVVTVDTTKGEFESLQLTGNESLQFVIKSIPDNENEEENLIIVSPYFKIYDFDESSDHSDLTLLPEGVHSRVVTFKFASKQESSVFDNKSPLEYGFVGKIAVNQNIAAGTYAEDIDFLAVEEENTTDCPGLINELALKYFAGEAFEIEATDNTILLSPKRFTYPNKKITKNMNLLQLINYATKYAWKKSNDVQNQNDSGTSFSQYGWSNYFFWQDLNGWHFKSATKMVSDAKSKEIKEFTFNQDVLSGGRIRRLDVISDFSISKAFSDGLLYSYYTRIEPNYDDIYARFLSDETKYKETFYEYNYASDYSPIIEQKRLLPDVVYDPIEGDGVTLEQWVKTRKNEQLKIEDRLFGNYENRQYNDKKELYRIIGKGYDVDSVSFDGRLENLEYNPDLSDYNLYQDGMWQEMFDCVDVMGTFSRTSGDNVESTLDDCSVLRKLKQIKAETFRYKALYRKALEYKEKWNLYRYSICCDGTTETDKDRLVIIKDHKKIAPNIYRYAWAEVYIIPKAEVGFIAGFGFTGNEPEELPTSDQDLYEAEITGPRGLNASYFYDPDEKIAYTPHIDLETSYNRTARGGYYSGVIYFHPLYYDDELYDGVTGSSSWDSIKHLFKGVSAEGLTLTFHNSQYSPFLVVEKPNAIRGVTSNYSGAYNLNEIMNRNLLGEGFPSQTSVSGASADIVYYQRSPIDFGGSDVPGSVYQNDFSEQTEFRENLIGPGINANSDLTEYPSSFDMMPIGGYKPVESGGVGCSAIPFGHIVKLSSVSYDDLMKVGMEPRNYPVETNQKRFFYFSSENAHDGNCSGECEL